jgi:Ca-activated chloride channel homolog
MQRVLLSLIVGAGWLLAEPASACETALLLAIDVSSSIDEGEYHVQTDGMADALLDPDIAEALEQGQVALSVIQWSGIGSQMVAMPWTRIQSQADIAAFSKAAREMPRAFINSDTAVGDAIAFASIQFLAVRDCHHLVIDVSGDGTANAGTATRTASHIAELAGITINGIAIESIGVAVTNFYRQQVITKGGFVITARGHLEYPKSIREKIRREVIRLTG